MERFESESTDKRVGSIYETRNYGKFHLSKLNRKIDQKHLASLIKNIKHHKAVIEPIQVDQEFNIVDGQHRFMASKKLHRPVYYYVDNHVSVMSADLLNSKTKHWQLLTYVNRGVEMMNQNYVLLNEKIKKYGRLFSTSIIAEFYSGSRGYYQALKDRNYIFRPDPEIDAFMDAMSNAVKGKNKHPSKGFMRGMLEWYRWPKTRRDRLMSLVNEKFIRLAPSKKSDCMDYIGSTYNHNLSRNSKIKYFIDSDKKFHFE